MTIRYGRVVNTVTGIRSARIDGKTVEVDFTDQPAFAFHSLWLRDSCACAACIHGESKQKVLSASDLPADIRPIEAAIDGGELRITWPDGHLSRYAPEFLAANTPRGRQSRQHHPVLWNRELTDRFPQVPFDQVLNSDPARFELLKHLVDYGVVRVADVSTDERKTEQLANLVGIIRETPHGRIYDVRTLPNVHNLAYGSDALSLHVDGSYHYYSPGPMLFHFIETTPAGGETVLVDGFSVARTLEAENVDAFELLCRLPWRNAYWNAGMDLRAANPPIGKNENGDLTHVILNQYTSYPEHFDADEIEAAYAAWRHIHEIASRDELQVKIKMPAGDALFFDNRRVLHTRTAFDSQAAPRRLRSCYMERDTLHSNLRVLARKLGDPLQNAIFTLC